MLKHAMLAGAMMIALPAVAQTTTSGQVAPTSATPVDQTAPVQSTAPVTGQATPQTTSITPDAGAAQTNGQATTTSSTDASTTAAQPATGDAVAQAVDQQFATYDKDANGALSRTEFADWMVALKSQSDPSTKADSPDTKKWVGAAFAQADKDKSKALSKAEVTGFLAQGQKG